LAAADVAVRQEPDEEDEEEDEGDGDGTEDNDDDDRFRQYIALENENACETCADQ
jgi:hypothetical protein